MARELMDHIDDPVALMRGIDVRLTHLEKQKSTKQLTQLRKEYSEILKAKKVQWAKTQKSKQEIEEEKKRQEKLNEIAWKIMKFVDKNTNSEILDRGGHPFSQWLAMKYTKGNLYIWFRYQNSPYSNGSQEVVVKFKGKMVFKNKDRITSIYKPGDWEELITNRA